MLPEIEHEFLGRSSVSARLHMAFPRVRYRMMVKTTAYQSGVSAIGEKPMTDNPRATPHRDSVTMAFTTDQVARLAGISRGRLRYWERTGTFEPTYVEARDSGPYRRIYSFQDLVNLRAIARLRVDFDVPLSELRSVTRYLREHRDSPWSELAVRVYGNHLVFRDPASGQWMTADPMGQLTFELAFEDVRNESERDARRLLNRSPEQHGQIKRNRNVMSNRWVFAGTRIPVYAVLDFHHAGYDRTRILAEYPTLSSEDIDAALVFAERHAAA